MLSKSCVYELVGFDSCEHQNMHEVYVDVLGYIIVTSLELDY
jgi:hypothetical protein